VTRAGRRSAVALVGAMVALVASLAAHPSAPAIALDPRPNILLVLTDDQTLDTLPADPPAMPWLQSQLEDPAAHWLWFPRAVVSTPLCCPSRATILTGQYDLRTHVRTNEDGALLDDTNTLPVWLHDAGYHTGLVGKYLNAYPWGRPPFIPPGWDRWFAKQNASDSTAYYNYDIVDQGLSRHYGETPDTYATDVLGEQAVRFVREAPPTQPWFLYFAPNAPHLPWMPADRHAGAFASMDPPIPPLATLNDVTGKPSYVRALPAKTELDRQGYIEDDRNERAMLLSVDAWFQALFEAIEARGELDNTVIIFLTDNGYTFGLHRLDGKRFPYTPSIGVPFAIRSPWAAQASMSTLASNLDIAGTIASLADVTPGLAQDGIDLSPAIRGDGVPTRRAVFLDWGGDAVVPPWQGIVTNTYTYVRNADGFEELYGAGDRFQLHNLAVRTSPQPALLVRARRLFQRNLAQAQG
jgi:arylsulfatase A-like enzyme